MENNKIYSRRTKSSAIAASISNSSSSKSLKKNNNNTNGGGGGGRKRDALADLTNSLIPTEVLLDLCSNSISSSKAYDLLRRSQSLNFPISKSSQNSKTDSKSDTSIGSSNFNNVRCVRNSHLSNSSSVNLGNECGKIAVYSRRQTSEYLEPSRKIDSEHVSSVSVKKTKDEGNVIPVHSSATPSSKAKNKQKAIAVALDLNHDEKERAKEKEIPVPLSFTPVEKPKDKGKAAAGSRSSIPVEKPKDKGKLTAVSFNSTSAEKGKNKGKAVDVTFSHLNKQAEDKEKLTAMDINQPLKKERKNASAAISSCPPLRRTRSVRDKHNEADDVKPSKAWSEPHPKQRKRRRSEKQTVSDDSWLQELEEQKAKFQAIDATELLVEEVSDID